MTYVPTMRLEDIRSLYLDRKRDLDELHATAEEVSAIYRGKIEFPLPQLDAAERPIVANLLMTGVDQYGSRTASLLPEVYAPVYRSETTKGAEKRAQDRADTRREVWRAAWDNNRLHLAMQKRARYYYAYAKSPIMVRPNPVSREPRWRVLHPFTVFPSEMDVGEIVPQNTIVASTHTLGWLKRNYPDAYARINRHPNPDEEYVCLEWIDADEYVYAVVGADHMPSSNAWGAPTTQPSGEIILLDSVQNRANRPWVVYPARTSLEDPQGQFDGVTGIYYWWSQLMALTVLGVKRGIWPEQWLTGDDAEIITEADPLRGITGRVRGGTLQQFAIDPQYAQGQFIDRLERNMRLEGGVPPELGGEAASNIRTGRRGDQVLSNAIDFHIQQAHQMFEASLEEECALYAEIDKAYFPSRKTVFVSMTRGEIEYVPRETWETSKAVVRYSQAGLDIAQLTVSAGQRIGMGTMSKRSFQEIDPLIRDAEKEEERVITEQLEQAGLTAIQQRASQDPAFLEYLPDLHAGVMAGEGLFQAYKRVSEEIAAKQQAQQQGAAPAEQPGLAAPGIQPAIGPPPMSLSNLTDTLANLRRPQTSPTVPAAG